MGALLLAMAMLPALPEGKGMGREWQWEGILCMKIRVDVTLSDVVLWYGGDGLMV